MSKSAWSMLSDTLTPALTLMKVATDRSWPDILRPAGRVLCVSLARTTQPYGNTKEAQQTGINAIRTDIYGKKSGGGIVTVWKDYMPTSPTATGATRLWVGRDGKAYGVENNLFDLEGKQLEAHHRRYRSKSTGRVSKASQEDREVGRWVFLDRLVVKKDKIEKFIKKLGKLVGFAKGGWAACARALGGVRGIQPWVSHQKSSGRVIDQTENTDNPSIEMINDVRYIDRCISDRQIQHAVDIAAGRMTRNAEYIIAYNARKAGFAVK